MMENTMRMSHLYHYLTSFLYILLKPTRERQEPQEKSKQNKSTGNLKKRKSKRLISTEEILKFIGTYRN